MKRLKLPNLRFSEKKTRKIPLFRGILKQRWNFSEIKLVDDCTFAVTVRSKIPVKRLEAIISQWSSQSLLKLTLSLHFEPIINTKLNLQVADSSTFSSTFFTHCRIRVESILCNIFKIRMSASTSQIASCGLLSRNCCAVDRGRVNALGDCCAVDRRGVKRRSYATYLYCNESSYRGGEVIALTETVNYNLQSVDITNPNKTNKMDS